jgi:hypothetical protein
MKTNPRPNGTRAELKDIKSDSREVSRIFSISISKPAKNNRKIIPRYARKSTITKDDSELKRIPLRTGIPSKIPAKIWPTTEGKPIRLNRKPITKVTIKINGTSTNISIF